MQHIFCSLRMFEDRILEVFFNKNWAEHKVWVRHLRNLIPNGSNACVCFVWFMHVRFWTWIRLRTCIVETAFPKESLAECLSFGFVWRCKKVFGSHLVLSADDWCKDCDFTAFTVRPLYIYIYWSLNSCVWLQRCQFRFNCLPLKPLMHSSPTALRPRSPISERTEKAPNFQQNSLIDEGRIIPQMLHVWNIHLHLP